MVELAVQLNLYLNHFPKHEKHGLAQQMRNSLYEMFGYMIEAQKRYHKKTSLGNLDIEHEKLRWFNNLAYELGYYNFYNGKEGETCHHRFLVVSRMVDEIGCLIGGWMRSEKQEES
jgi:hypothetical protein